VLASPRAGREFLVRSCGILLHGDAVVFQEADDGRGGKAYALPGGHLEFGEALTACLAREFYEETGLNAEPDKLAYVHENFYDQRGVRTHEIGFYFVLDLASEFPEPDPDGYLPSREPHIRIRLLRFPELVKFRVLPEFLREALPRDARDSFAHPIRHLVTREP